MDSVSTESIPERILAMTSKKRTPRPATEARELKLNASQAKLLELLETKPIVVASGVAGSGKTFAALVYASRMLKRGRIDKIVIVRSPLEMGRSRLGYLPGSASEKMAPYLEPVYTIAKKLGIPEEAIVCYPLCHIQGLTFEDAVIVADEVQNLDIDEFRALVSRLGVTSAIILCGDPEQDTRGSGGFPVFMKAVERLDCVGIQHFTEQDNMRHPAITAVLGALRGL